MSIDNIKEALPDFAKDLKLNLSSIVKTTELTEQQLWGALVATAAATSSAVKPAWAARLAGCWSAPSRPSSATGSTRW